MCVCVHVCCVTCAELAPKTVAPARRTEPTPDPLALMSEVGHQLTEHEKWEQRMPLAAGVDRMLDEMLKEVRPADYKHTHTHTHTHTDRHTRSH